MKFRFRLIIDAVQLRPDNWPEMAEFVGAGRLSDNKPALCSLRHDDTVNFEPLATATERMCLLIPQRRLPALGEVGWGMDIAVENDWIITRADGALTVCKADVFAATYEPAPDAEGRDGA